VAGHHQLKKWWRNLLEQQTINVRYRGKWIEASAKAFAGDVQVIAPLLPDYLKRFPASARIRGLTLDSSGDIENPEKLGEEAKKVVMITIRMLTPEGLMGDQSSSSTLLPSQFPASYNSARIE
jgi:hypothetical protein